MTKYTFTIASDNTETVTTLLDNLLITYDISFARVKLATTPVLISAVRIEIIAIKRDIKSVRYLKNMFQNKLIDFKTQTCQK